MQSHLAAIILAFLALLFVAWTIRKAIQSIVQPISEAIQGLARSYKKVLSIFTPKGLALIAAVIVVGVLYFIVPWTITEIVLLGLLDLIILVVCLAFCNRRQYPWWCYLIIAGLAALEIPLSYGALHNWLFLHPGSVPWMCGGIDILMLLALAIFDLLAL